MNNKKVIYETGATSHAVNDLILFTDNTRELAILRDSIYDKMRTFDLLDPKNARTWDLHQFEKLLKKSKQQYYQTFPNNEDNAHIREMTNTQNQEFKSIYLSEFEDWKREHEAK